MWSRSTLGWIMVLTGCNGAATTAIATDVSDSGALANGDNDASGGGATNTVDAASAGDASGAAEAGCGIPTAATNVDGRCACDDDCPLGAICETEDAGGAPGGECIQPCDPQQGSSCGSNGTCVTPPADSTSSAVCARTCGVSSDCPAGRICDMQQATCIVQCVADSDCLSGHCDAYTAQCDSGAVPAGLGLQARCTTNSDCKSNYCNPVGLRCTSTCEVGVSQCPEGGVCLAVSASNDLGDCAPPCNANGTCEDPTLQCGEDAIGQSGCAFPNMNCLGASAKDVYGADCNCQADCPTGATCGTETATGNPHGICLDICEMGVTDCGPAAQCFATMYGDSCAATCKVDTDCPGVADVCASNICTTVCQSDSDCLSGTCNLYNGRCGVAPSVGAGEGATCRANGDCISGNCLVLGGALGVCSSLCAISRQGCPDSAICFDTGDGDLGLCLKACEVDGDCLLATLKCVLTSGTAGYCYPQN